MKSKMTLSFLALAALMFLPTVSRAQTSTDSGVDKSAKVRHLTGCLSKGDSSDEYNLTTAKGNTWELKSDSSSVDFASHVGHKVAVTGTVNNAAAHGAKEKVKDKTMSNPTEHGHMTVTNVKMISESCPAS